MHWKYCKTLLHCIVTLLVKKSAVFVEPESLLCSSQIPNAGSIWEAAQSCSPSLQLTITSAVD